MTLIEVHSVEGICNYDLEIIAQKVVECNVDLFGMQEVDVLTTRNHKVDQPEQLRQILNQMEQRTDWSQVFAKAIDYQGGQYGNAILSTLTLLENRFW